MTGPEFAAIRKSLGLSVIEFGRAIGYQGTNETVSVTVRRYEAPNGRKIPPWIARLARMYQRYGIPREFMKA
jgi:transcriptional regulator with XRE-family HTH domain